MISVFVGYIIPGDFLFAQKGNDTSFIPIEDAICVAFIFSAEVLENVLTDLAGMPCGFYKISKPYTIKK